MSNSSSNPDSTTVGRTVLIERFQLSSVTGPNVILVLGPKECGKTTFLNRYCEEKLKQEPNHMFAKFSSLKNKCTTDALKDIILQQSKAEHADRQVSIVIDGLSQDNLKEIKSELWMIVRNGRHYRISIVIADTGLNLPPDIRCNIDYMIFWPNKNISTTKRMYDHFFGTLSFTYFDNLVKVVSRQGQALVIALNNDNIKWYRNTETPETDHIEDNMLPLCSVPKEDRQKRVSKATDLLDDIKNKIRELESIMGSLSHE